MLQPSQIQQLRAPGGIAHQRPPTPVGATPVPTVVHHFGGSSSSGSDYDDYNGAEYQNEIDEYEVREKII